MSKPSKRRSTRGKKNRNKKPSGFMILVLLIAAALLCFEYYRLYREQGGFEQPPVAEQPSGEKESAPQGTSGKVLLQEKVYIPLCGLQKHRADHELRDFAYYSLCYRESYEQAEWSAYHLSVANLKKETGRTDDFRPDDAISTKSATLADYKGSGFDRGHLTPAADMAFSSQAMSETFYMSNMSPQAPQFNRGIWMYLETQVREWATRFGDVYVVSGPVLDKDASAYDAIGKNKVSVPEYYYKVILAPLYEDDADRQTPGDAKQVMAIGFILPNKGSDGTFWDYAVSVDEVEKRTGLDFYSLLDDSVENSVEASYRLESWR